MKNTTSLFSKLSLRNKIFLLPIISAIGFSLYLIYSLYINIQNTNNFSIIEHQDYPILEMVNKNLISLLSIEETFIEVITIEDKDFLTPAYDNYKKIKNTFPEIIKLNLYLKSDINIIEKHIDDYFNNAIHVINLIVKPENNENIIHSEAKKTSLKYQIITKLLSDFKEKIETSFKQKLKQSKTNTHNANITGLTIGFIMIILSFSISLLITRLITQPINRISKYADDITKGKWDIILSNNRSEGQELDKLINAFLHMQNKIITTIDDLVSSKNIALKSDKNKTEFLSTMSHELRTPMNGILGLLELLKKTKTDETQNEYIDAVLISSKKLLVIINDIMELSNLNNNTLKLENKAFNLKHLMSETAKPLHISLENKLDFTVNYPENLQTNFLGDPSKIQQIIFNLLNNAAKFTKKGFINLSINCELKDANTSTITFTISDSGIGISSDQQKTIFKDYTQANSSSTREHSGLGLGLSIANNLVELMGGKLSLESTIGKGSTFFFNIILPICNEELKNEEKNIVCNTDHNNIDLRAQNTIIIDTKTFNQTKNLLQDSFQTLLNAFFNNIETALIGIKSWQQSDGINELIRFPHNIKSTSTHLGAKSLAKLANECESCFRDGDIKEGLLKSTSLEKTFQDTIDELQRLGYKKD